MPRFDFVEEVIEITQLDEDLLHTTIAHPERTPHYAALPHGVLTTVWTPEGGYGIHVTSLMIGVEGAGVLEIFHDATLFMTMPFSEKRNVPMGMGGDLTFDADVVLKATFTADNATDSGFITAVGHEHE